MSKSRATLIGLALLVGLTTIGLASNNIVQWESSAALLAATDEVIDTELGDELDELEKELDELYELEAELDKLEDELDELEPENDEAEELADDAKHTFMDAKSGSNFDSSDDEDEHRENRRKRVRKGIPLPPAGFEDKVLTRLPHNPFGDTETDNLEGVAAGELYRRGVIGGYPDGDFKGDREVNRAEASKFLLLARFESVDETDEDAKFSDSVRGQWYVKYIKKAADKGIIRGYSDGSFRPANTVNTAEFMKMLTLTFDLELDLTYTYTDVPADAWYAPYAGAAQHYELFPGRTDELDPADPLTRDEVSVAIYQFLANR